FSVLLFFLLFHYTYIIDNYILSLHDALPISKKLIVNSIKIVINFFICWTLLFCVKKIKNISTSEVKMLKLKNLLAHSPIHVGFLDRKSTRLNSSHVKISYAVFCLKKNN